MSGKKRKERQKYRKRIRFGIVTGFLVIWIFTYTAKAVELGGFDIEIGPGEEAVYPADWQESGNNEVQEQENVQSPQVQQPAQNLQNGDQESSEKPEPTEIQIPAERQTVQVPQMQEEIRTEQELQQGLFPAGNTDMEDELSSGPDKGESGYIPPAAEPPAAKSQAIEASAAEPTAVPTEIPVVTAVPTEIPVTPTKTPAKTQSVTPIAAPAAAQVVTLSVTPAVSPSRIPALTPEPDSFVDFSVRFVHPETPDTESFPWIKVQSAGRVSVLSIRHNRMECQWHWEGEKIVPEIVRSKGENKIEILVIAEDGKLMQMNPWIFS